MKKKNLNRYLITLIKNEFARRPIHLHLYLYFFIKYVNSVIYMRLLHRLMLPSNSNFCELMQRSSNGVSATMKVRCDAYLNYNLHNKVSPPLFLTTLFTHILHSRRTTMLFSSFFLVILCQSFIYHLLNICIIKCYVLLLPSF